MNRHLAAVLFSAGLVVGAGTYGVVDQVVEPHCPTEDSCAVDYRNGRWHITEVTP